MVKSRFYVNLRDTEQPVRRYPQQDMYYEGAWCLTGIQEGTANLTQVPDTLCVLLNVKGFDTV
jgi:hypothetical protein